MNVVQYTFQSPSTNQVQVGKLDQSSVQEETKSSSSKQEAVQSKTIGEILAKPSAEETIKSNVTQNKLDLYV